jgi:hypothetical protein
VPTNNRVSTSAKELSGMILCFLRCKSHARARGIEPPSGAAVLCGAISTSKVVAVAVLAAVLNLLAVRLVSTYVLDYP